MLANTFILKNFIYVHDSQDRAYDRSYKNTPTGVALTPLPLDTRDRVIVTRVFVSLIFNL